MHENDYKSDEKNTNEYTENTQPLIEPSDPPFPPAIDVNEQRKACFVGQKYESYYQEKFNQITPQKQFSGFNIGAFFFGLMWLFYRKMYGYGLILLGLILISCVIPIPESIDRSISIAIAVTMGLFGNGLYKNFVEKKIKEIEKMHPNAIEHELEKQGGTNIWAGIGILFPAIIAIYIVVTISGNY